MGYFKNTFEGGTNGANLTVAGSGGASGDAFDTIVVNNAAKNGGGPAVQYLTAAAIQGALGLRITTQAATSYVRWSDPTPGARGVARLPFYFNGNPSAQLDLATIRADACAMDREGASSRRRTYSLKTIPSRRKPVVDRLAMLLARTCISRIRPDWRVNAV